MNAAHPYQDLSWYPLTISKKSLAYNLRSLLHKISICFYCWWVEDVSFQSAFAYVPIRVLRGLRAGPALGGWGPPRTWTLGPPIYNTLHLIHSRPIHVNKISTSLTNVYKAFSTAVVPNPFWCIPAFAHFGTFLSSPITQFQQGGWRVETSFLRWFRSHV